jgi:BASS family bile acid:Na+ symporter
MLSAGLRTRIPALLGVLRNGALVALVLVANLLVVPLLGLAVGLLFALSTAGVVALVLVASSPGAPFGAKMAMIQKGDVVTGSVLQVVLAAVGSVTFPITANLLLGWADLGDDIAIPVGRLMLSVAVLQLVPFTVGLAMRAWAPATAAVWMPPVARTSNLAFLGVLAFGVLGSWNQIVDLIGSRGLAVELPVASWLARRRTGTDDGAHERAAADAVEGAELSAPAGPRPVQASGTAERGTR